MSFVDREKSPQNVLGFWKKYKNASQNSPASQWLRLPAFIAEGTLFDPWLGN